MLIELRLRDFCCFEAIEIPLAGQGLVWVAGINEDTRAATSNGSGKSTLFKGLTWALHGEVINGDPGDPVIRKGATCAVGELDFEGGYTLRRERRRGAPRLFLLKDGKDLGKSKQDIQDWVFNKIGMDFATFKNTVLYGQNDIERFASQRLKDADRKRMLHRILRLEVLGRAHEIAKERNRRLKAEEADLTAKIAVARSKIGEHDLPALRAKVDAWEATRQAELSRLRASVAVAKAEARRIVSEAPDVDALLKRKAALEADLRVVEAAREAAEAARESISKAAARVTAAKVARSRSATELRALDQKLEALAGDKCDLCQSPLTEGPGRAHVEELEAQRSSCAAELAEHAKELAEAEEWHEVLLETLATTESSIRSRRGVPNELRQVEDAIREAETAAVRAKAVLDAARSNLDAIKERKAAVNPYGEQLEAVEARVKEHKKALKAFKRDLEGVVSQRSAIDFWVRGFSPQGLPSFVLDGIMPYLSERANHYLETLSDGDITMAFSTQRELKSAKGEFRDKIDVSWVVEGVEDKPPSGGQERKMEIATDLALMDLVESREGGGVGLFVADEILDGLDAEGTDRVLQLLHLLRARRGSIFVISHSDSMSEIFEKSLTVRKRGGVSTLEWSR